MNGEEPRSRRADRFFALVPIAFLACAVLGWFVPLSRVGIGDWDWYFSDAWVSATGLRERGWPALWSVQLAGGAPLAGDPESLSDSPLLALPILFGPILGTKLLVVALLLAGLAGCHRLGMRWLGDPLGATIFAFAFLFSGYFAIHLRAGHLPWALFSLVPWILYFADRLLFEAEPGRADAIGLVVSFALLVTGQVYHPLVFFLLPVAIVYALVSARRLEAERVKRLALLVLCAVGLGAPRLLAVIGWQDRNPRLIHNVGTIPLGVIARMLLTPIKDYKDAVTWGGSGVWEYWSYVGFTATILAVAALVRRGPALGFALACIAAGIVLAWQAPWGNPLAGIAPHLPFLSSARIYPRFLGVTVFGIALAAGSGAVRLRSLWGGRVIVTLMLVVLTAEYARVVLPIWTRVFDTPQAEAYSDWGVTLPGPPYRSIRQCPPFQTFSANRETFNSRMLPLLMAGAVVSNAYVTLALPWLRPATGDVVEEWPADGYRITNHEIDIWGDLQPGQMIKVNLHYSNRYWKVVDRSSARVVPDGAGMRIEILEPCSRVRIVYRSDFDVAGWIVAGAALGATWYLVRRPASNIYSAAAA